MPTRGYPNKSVHIPLLVPIDNPSLFEAVAELEEHLKKRYPQIREVDIRLRNPIPLATAVNLATYRHEVSIVLKYVGKNLPSLVTLLKIAVDFVKSRDKRVEAGQPEKSDFVLNEIARERETMRQIRDALISGRFKEPFRARDVNVALGIAYAGVFLPKHRVGNPGQKGRKNTEHFIQVARGLYRLKNPT